MCTYRFKFSVVHYTNSMRCWFSPTAPWSKGFTQENRPFNPRINMPLALFTVLFKRTELIDREKQPVKAFYFAMNSPGQEKNLNVSAAFSLTARR